MGLVTDRGGVWDLRWTLLSVLCFFHNWELASVGCEMQERQPLRSNRNGNHTRFTSLQRYETTSICLFTTTVAFTESVYNPLPFPLRRLPLVPHFRRRPRSSPTRDQCPPTLPPPPLLLRLRRRQRMTAAYASFDLPLRTQPTAPQGAGLGCRP